MGYLQADDLLQIMHTCRTLYGLGIPLLLETVDYTHTQRHPMLFLHFVLSDPQRISCIRSLQCNYMDHPLPNPAAHSLFHDFLRYATQLHTLDISFHHDIEIKDSALARNPLTPTPGAPRL